MRINNVTELGPQLREGTASVMSLMVGTFPEVLSKRPSPPTGLSKAEAGARTAKVLQEERVPAEGAAESSGFRGLRRTRELIPANRMGAGPDCTSLSHYWLTFPP